MRRPSAPGALPDLLGKGWSRVRGGRGADGAGGAGGRLRQRAQMVRAAQGHRPAVFKAIRNGGCHGPVGLGRQLTYLTSKSSLILDPTGQFDSHERLTPKEVAALADRFTRTWEAHRQNKLGHSSHLLMSFPAGTGPEAVAAVAERVCRDFFHGEDGRPAFDYIVAIHTDRAHPHAHIVLNRHSPDGATFYLRSGHQFSYELFRESMASHGDAFGLRLEATRRLDRGLVARAAPSLVAMQARTSGHEAPERPREGIDRERATEAVARASLAYKGLARAASDSGFAQVAEALQRASTTLARNGIVLPTKEFAMAATQGSFDGLLREFARSVDALERGIAAAAPADRPGLERGLTQALASVADLDPLGEASPLLRRAPSVFGVYSAVRIERDALDRLEAPALRASVDAALGGTGLSTSEVLARVQAGADTAALEDHWHASDKEAVAATLGLDLDRPDHEDRVLDRLEAAYDAVDAALEAAGVLHDAALQEEAAERGQGLAPIAERPPIVERPFVVERPSAARERGAEQAPAERAPEAGKVREPGPAHARTAAEPPRVAAQLPPSPERQRAAPPWTQPDREAEAAIRATAARVRDLSPAHDAFPDPRAAEAFAAALRSRLSPDEAARLAAGDRTALDRLTSDPIDRLALARAHIELDPSSRHSAEWRAVTKDITSAQIDARQAHDEDGHTHD